MTAEAPSVVDILIAARAYGWPSVTAAGVSVGPGEPAWRQAVEAMTYDTRRHFWTAWGEINRGGIRHRALSPLNATRSQADDSPDLQPSAREFAVFVRAAAAVQRHGLALHPDRCRFAWYDDYGDDPCWGSAGLHDGVVVVQLRRGMSDGLLFQTAVHELAHAHDLATYGDEAYELFGIEELERRARAVEAQVCFAEGLNGLFL